MKKIILLSFISLTSLISLNSLTSLVFAEVSTQSAQELRDRIEKKVVELAKNFQKPYNGEITSLGAKTIAINTQSGAKTIFTSEATTYFRIRSGNKTTIDLKSLKIGDDISALGTIDPATNELTAKQIIAKIKRNNVVGKITAVNKTILTVNSATKIDIDGVVLKTASNSGKITMAKLADFKEGATIFAITHSPDDKTGVFFVLKALVISP